MFNLNDNKISEINLISEKHFSSILCQRGNQLLNSKNLNISFLKGSIDSSFIISGLFFERETIKTKLKYSTTKDQAIDGSCTCSVWSKENHCHHMTALFNYFFQYEYSKQINSKPAKNADIKKLLNGPSFSHGVSPRSFGTIVRSHNDLFNALPNQPFKSSKILLQNKKVVEFPKPEEIPPLAKIHINIVSADNTDIYSNSKIKLDHKFIPIFSLEIYNEEPREKISILDGEYIFDWTSGSAYLLPEKIKRSILRFQRLNELNTLDLLIDNFSSLIPLENIKLDINGKKIQKDNLLTPKFLIKIQEATKKGFMNLTFQLSGHESADEIIKFPKIFNLIVAESGLLGSFRTKNNALDFIGHLFELEKDKLLDAKISGVSLDVKEIIWDYLYQIREDVELITTDKNHSNFYLFKSSYFYLFFRSFIKFFTRASVRFSQNRNDEELVFTIPKQNFFSGIGSFVNALKPIGAEVFFNSKKAKNWQGNIKINRNHQNIDWFDLNISVSEHDLNIVKNSMIGNNYIITKDQELILLQEKDNDLLNFLKKHIGFNRKGKKKEDKDHSFEIKLKRSRIFEIFELKKYGITNLLNKEEEALCEKLLNFDGIPDYPLPDLKNVELRSYQETGYQWFSFLYENKLGACLADDMGLGKTLQTIIFLQKNIETLNRVLIVCPVSIIINWQNEFEKFSFLKTNLYYGKERTLDKDCKIHITSYGILKRELESEFKDLELDVVIFDEVQHIKNIKSLGAIAARNLKSKFNICLTGTPVENDIVEFYNILDIAIPGVLGDLKNLKQLTHDESFIPNIKKSVRPFILRRTKSQVLTELPEKIENKILLSFSAEEEKAYRDELLKINVTSKEMANTKGNRFGEVLKNLLKMRQLCLWQQHKNLISTKIDFLIENIEQLISENHKILIFSQFTTYLNMIMARIQEKSWKFSRIDGSYTHKKRESEIKNFQEGDHQIFLISLKAGGVGLNLTAANYVFIMDPWWNPAVENQAIDRAHRIGQKNCVTVYRLIMKNSIEEKVLQLQERKKQLFQDLLGSENDAYFNGKLSMKDFEFLLTSDEDAIPSLE